MEEKEIKEKKKMSKTSKQLLVTALALVLLIAGSYAWLTLTKTGEKTNILRAGKLSLILDDTTSNGILLEKAVPMSETKGKTTQEYTFTLQNEGSTALNYTIYLDDVALEDTEERMQDKYVRYRLVKNGAETIDLLTNLTDRALDTGIIEATQTNTYTLQVWIDSEADNAVMDTIFSAKLRVTGEQGNKSNEGTTYTYTNTNIKAAYTYDATSCVTGEEETCSQISLTNTDSDIPAGTIIKYAVNDTEEKYFYVLHDDGETLTLQQKENTIEETMWIEADLFCSITNVEDCNITKITNDIGPLTALEKLESATAGWSNVNDQTYTMGTTIFKDNPYTGCKVESGNVICYTNKYTMASRTAKSRMITIQEALSVGCTGVFESCPIWMGIDIMENYYWTMNSLISTNVNHQIDVFTINPNKHVLATDDTHTTSRVGARAVITINK